MPLLGGLGDVFDVQVRFSLDNTQFLNGLERTASRLQGIGTSMTRNLTLPILGFGAAAVRAALMFNAGMANVATLIPGNIERVNELKGAVQGMAVEMGKSTADLTQGLYQVISAFMDTADTVSILEVNARLAKAGLSSTLDAINLTSAVTKAYGDTSAAAMQKVADLSMLVVRLGQTTFPELAGSIGLVTPIAAALRVRVEELMAAFATLTGVTGNAANVSTQLKAVLSAMLSPSEAMAKAIKEIGFEGASAMISQLGLVGAMRALIESTDGTQEAIGRLFPNVRALPAVFALAGGQAAVFDEKMRAMGDSAGVLDAAFREQTEGVNETGHAYEMAKAKLEVLAQRMGDRLMPALAALVEALEPVVNWLSGLIEKFDSLTGSQQRFVLGMTAVVIGAGPVLTMLARITTAVRLLATALGAARLAALGLWGALGLAVGAAGWAITREARRMRAGGEFYRVQEPWETRGTYAPGTIAGVEYPAPRTAEDVVSILRQGLNLRMPDGGLLTLENLAEAFEQGGQPGSQALLDAAATQFGATQAMDEGIGDLEKALAELEQEITGGGGGVTITDETVEHFSASLAAKIQEHFAEVIAAAKEARAAAGAPAAKPEPLARKPSPQWLPGEQQAITKEKERLRAIAAAEMADAIKAAEMEVAQKMDDLAAALQEPMKNLYRSLRKSLLDGMRMVGADIVSGDISRALRNVFDSLGSIIARHIETRIGAQVPGFGGELLGAFGGGLVGAAIGLIGGLFGGKGRMPGADVSTPIFAYITNWDQFWQFGTTLPESFIYSGRYRRYDVDPHGRTLDIAYTEWRTGLHFDY